MSSVVSRAQLVALHCHRHRIPSPEAKRRNPPLNVAADQLQDACSAQPAAIKEVAPVSGLGTLQDACQVQVPLLVGLISKFTDCTLQDDIVLFVRRLIAKGQDILDQPSSRSTKENTLYDEQKDPAPGPLAASAGAV